MIPFSHNDINKSIRKSFHVLQGLKLTDWDLSPTLTFRPPSSEFRKIAFNPAIKYEDIFLEAHRLKEYNIQLNDGALFQFWVSSDRKQSRYAFLPNPFESIDQDLLLAFKEEDLPAPILEEQLYSELESHLTRPIIRYDFDEKAYIPVEHPASHLTIGIHTNSRWAVNGFISPELFSLYIAKQYYEINWNYLAEEEACLKGFRNKLDRRIMQLLSELRAKDFSFFSDAEKSHNYFY